MCKVPEVPEDSILATCKTPFARNQSILCSTQVTLLTELAFVKSIVKIDGILNTINLKAQ